MSAKSYVAHKNSRVLLGFVVIIDNKSNTKQHNEKQYIECCYIIFVLKLPKYEALKHFAEFHKATFIGFNMVSGGILFPR